MYITILFEKYGLYFFQNDLELQSTLSFSKYCNLDYLFRFVTKFRCRLNLTMSLGFFDLFALFLRRDLVIICLRRFLLKWLFWFSQLVNLCTNIRHLWNIYSVSSYCKTYVLKEILHYFIFRAFVKITKNYNFFMPCWVEFC